MHRLNSSKSATKSVTHHVTNPVTTASVATGSHSLENSGEDSVTEPMTILEYATHSDKRREDTATHSDNKRGEDTATHSDKRREDTTTHSDKRQGEDTDMKNSTKRSLSGAKRADTGGSDGPNHWKTIKLNNSCDGTKRSKRSQFKTSRVPQVGASQVSCNRKGKGLAEVSEGKSESDGK